MDFAKLIAFQARIREQEPAIAFAGGVATYGTLVRATLAAVDKLQQTGLPAGALVAIDVRNPFHHLVLLLALALRGLPSASIQTSFTVAEAGLRPAAILTDGRVKHPPELNPIALDEDWFWIEPEGPLDTARLRALPGFPDDHAVTRLVFSSGTTGVPKATGFTSAIVERRLAHAALLHGGGSIAGLRAMTQMGLSTVAGYLVALGALASGGLVAFASQPADALHLIRLFGLGFLSVSVSQVEKLLATLGDGRPPASLQTLVIGGSKVPAELLTRARARLCSNVTFGYGTTETGTISHAPGSFLAALEGAAGYILPWVTLQAVDADDQPLPPGKEGIFRVRTDELALYAVEDEDGRRSFRDGWFYPGDVGTILQDGLVLVTGRTVEVVNRGGSIVAPELVERVLLGLPGINDAAAFAMPTAAGLDQLWAAVVTAAPIDEPALIAACRSRLADKAPDAIRRVAAIPRTESGKVRRAQLRDELLAARG